MVITRTILKNLAFQDLSLPEILTQANTMLCSENIEQMFVTLFMGILKTGTGELEYANAGHNPPLLSRQEGDFKYLNVPRCLVLGGMEDYQYQSSKIILNQKDKLFLYTDGVTEAMNGEGEIFSDERMFRVINGLQGKDVKGMIGGIRREIDNFVEDTPASDDVTMLALTLKEWADLFLKMELLL